MKTNPKMKAVVCTKYGPPEVLQIKDVKKPIPKENELLVRVHATTVSAADYRVRSFNVPASFWLPVRLMLGLKKPRKSILGMELSGKVEAKGKNVMTFKKGDEVFAATLQSFGAYAEYICLSEESTVAIKPPELTHEEAAAVPIGARTAFYYLNTIAEIKPDQKVLIYGASGSVGTYAVQLAKCPFSICKRALRKNGTYLNIGRPMPSSQMIWTSLTSNNKVVVGKNAPETGRVLNILKNIIEQGKLKPVIDRNYSLDEIVDAHRYADKGHKKGNVVITVK